MLFAGAKMGDFMRRCARMFSRGVNVTRRGARTFFYGAGAFSCGVDSSCLGTLMCARSKVQETPPRGEGLRKFVPNSIESALHVCLFLEPNIHPVLETLRKFWKVLTFTRALVYYKPY